jgi:hypothetical protein
MPTSPAKTPRPQYGRIEPQWRLAIVGQRRRVANQRRGKSCGNQKNGEDEIVPPAGEQRCCHEEKQLDSCDVPDRRGVQIPENGRDTYSAVNSFPVDLRNLYKKVDENSE